MRTLPPALVASLAALLFASASAAATGGVPAPPGPGVDAPDRPWDLVVLRLALALDPAERSVSGTATYEVALRAPSPSGATPLVLDEVGLEIGTVTVDGAAAEWQARDDQLIIPLDAAGGPGAKHTVVVAYRATPETGLHFRGPGPGSPDTYPEVWSQGEGADNRYWFPGYDHPNERFRYEGEFTAPAGWKVLTNTGMDVVNYLVMVAAAPYDVHGDRANQVWAPPGTPVAAVEPIWKPIPAMQARLAERTGQPYPWGPYRQVIVQRFLYGGMENTSATVESARLLQGAAERELRTDPESVAAHELAHQWYGDLLTCADWHHLWLNEGFATYFAADWMQTREGPDTAAAWAAQVRGWYRAATGRASLTGAWFLGPDTPPNAKVYVKGAAVLEMLRHQLGDATFWAGIRRYTAAHAHGLVETDDLRRAMEDVSGQELGWFFRQWTELPYAPKLDASWSWSAEGGLTVELTQAVDDDHPMAHLPLRVLVGGNDGATHSVTVPFAEARRTVQIALPWRPTWVAVDPDGALLFEGGMKQPAAAWAAQLAAGPPYARLVAAEGLGDVNGADAPQARDALAATLADASAAISLREGAAVALGKLRAPSPLLAALDDDAAPPRVRLAAAQALRTAARPDDAQHLAALRADERSGSIRAALLDALAAASPERALPAARLVLRSTAASIGADIGTLDVEYVSAAAVLGERGDPADLAVLLAAPVSRDRRTTGLTAATRIVSRMALGPDREVARAKVARSAESALDDRDLRLRQAAVGVLREVGDERSVNALERWRVGMEIEGDADRARDAVAAIRARRDTVTPPAPNEVDARLQALEERLKALERRDEKWMAP